jgi:molybdopterin-containing oxidoreductase family iron-sulfur binding subunit
MREIDLTAIRARLAGDAGRTWWRGLEELADTDEFRELLHREFPEGASELDDPAGRREFLKLMGASLALAGVAGCTRQPAEHIVPYVKAPEEIVPGKPLFFATAMPFAGAATPILVESHMGRPTKVEPNPEHPATRGGTDVFSQAAVLTLYDPDRSQTVKHLGDIAPWGQFLTAISGAINAQRALKGAGLRILTETVVSPTLADQIQQLIGTLPDARWVQWEPVSRDSVRAGAKQAFGEYVEPAYRFDKAEIVLSLDADFLYRGPGRLRHIRDFTARRRLVNGQTGMSRLYVAESTPTPTGVKADHRLSLKAAHVEALAHAIAAGLGVAGATAPASIPGVDPKWVAAVVSDLQSHRGAGLVVAGEEQPAAVHALAHAINGALGNVGQTVVYTPTPEAVPTEQYAAFRTLAGEMAAGKVDLLVIISANPVFTAPPDLAFAEAMNKVQLRVHMGLFEDETARLCHWHIPETHFLEAWSDACAFDGTVSIVQPLIAPLYENRSPHELLAVMSGKPDLTSLDIVRGFWRKAWDGGASGAWGSLADSQGKPFATVDAFWRRALHDGFIAGTEHQPKDVVLSASAVTAPSPLPAADALEITFRPDPNIWDGRFANNGWLQELPRPVTKISWDSVAHVSPATAERLGVSSGFFKGVIGIQQATDVVTLTLGGREIQMPVWVLPGQPDGSVMVTIGHGRTSAGRVGSGAGVDANPLRSTAAPWIASGLQIAKAGRTYPIACTQGHFALEGRNHVRAASLTFYKEEPEFAHHLGHTPGPEATLHGNQWKYDGYSWGMSVDLHACVGCNACVVACQSENNIPVVGKDQVSRQREMHWLRVDRYYVGSADNPEMFFQPMMCQHCETAPCEVVCPVAATVHSDEGLNDMVYNRCVGTRYCSNNCPYKVRRFNFLLYSDWTTPTLKMARNPDVTVRSRGVMEKCTYCVQRINHARVAAKREDRAIRDGEVVTACQAACPAGAIAFGNINDPAAEVTKMKKEPRNYGVLADLNTRPRTTYLAAVRNTNTGLAPEQAATGHGAGAAEAPASAEPAGRSH